MTARAKALTSHYRKVNVPIWPRNPRSDRLEKLEKNWKKLYRQCYHDEKLETYYDQHYDEVRHPLATIFHPSEVEYQEDPVDKIDPDLLRQVFLNTLAFFCPDTPSSPSQTDFDVELCAINRFIKGEDSYTKEVVVYHFAKHRFVNLAIENRYIYLILDPIKPG